MPDDQSQTTKPYLLEDLVYEGTATGMDVPLAETWGPEDVAFWTGTKRYQPWKDVAAFFRSAESHD